MASGVLVIGCGATAREIKALSKANGWSGMDLHCLPAELHNRPEKIPGAVQQVIRASRERYNEIFVAYGDCGTGGALDTVLKEEGVERIAGDHCYEFYAGSEQFGIFSEAEVGTFYLTDFLVRHFDRLVWQGLGIEKSPELLPIYFGNYRKLLYLAQTGDDELRTEAEEVANRLGLEFEYRYTGYGELEMALGDLNAALR